MLIRIEEKNKLEQVTNFNLQCVVHKKNNIYQCIVFIIFVNYFSKDCLQSDFCLFLYSPAGGSMTQVVRNTDRSKQASLAV